MDDVDIEQDAEEWLENKLIGEDLTPFIEPLKEDWTFLSHSAEGAKYHDGFYGSIMEKVAIKYDTSDGGIFELHKREREMVLENVREQAGLHGELTMFACFVAAMPKDFLLEFATWLDFRVSTRDIVNFVICDMILRFYGLPVSLVTRHPSVFSLTLTELNESYQSVRRAMRLADEKGKETCLNQPMRVDPSIQKMQRLCCSHWSNLFYCKHVSKIRLENQSSKQDLCVQPVVHLVTSVCAGFIYGGWLGDLNMRDVVLTLLNADSFAHVSQADVETLELYMDRDYALLSKRESTEDLIQTFQELGVTFLGTVRESKHFPFSLVKSSGLKTRPNVIVSGQLSTWVAKKGDLCAMVYRQGQGRARAGRLLTNARDLKPNEWVYEVARGQDPKSRFPHVRDEVGPNLDECKKAFIEMEREIFQLTLKQHTPDWFLACRFRATGIETHAIINCQANYITLDMKGNVEAMKDAAMLDPHVDRVCLQSTTVGTKRGRSPSQPIAMDPVPSRRKSSRSAVRALRGDPNTDAYWVNGKTKEKLLGLMRKFNLTCKVDKMTTRKELGRLIVEAFQDGNPAIEQFLAQKRNSTPPLQTVATLEQESSSGQDFDDSDDHDLDKAQPRRKRRAGSSNSSSSSTSQTTQEANTQAVVDPLRMADRQISFLAHLMPFWFMKPRDTDTQKCRKIGASSEDTIQLRIDNHLQTHSNFRILHMREYGLVCRREQEFAATSPDGVCGLYKKREGEGMEFQALCAVEIIKPWATDDIEVPLSTSGLPAFQVCTTGTTAFEQAVPKPEHRTQVIHHAAVLNVDYTLIVFSARTQIVRTVLVKVPLSLRLRLRGLLQLLQDRYMRFAYASEKLPRLAKDGSSVYGFAVEHHTAELYVQLWRRHRDEVIQNGTPPPCERLVPKTVSLWNHSMGNADPVRNILSASKVGQNGMELASSIWMSFFGYILYNAYRLYQLAIVESASLNGFEAVRAKRKEKLPFKKFLLDLASEMKLWGVERLIRHIPGLDKVHRAHENFKFGHPTSATSLVSFSLSSPIASRSDDEECTSRQKHHHLTAANCERSIIEKRLTNFSKHKSTSIADQLTCILCCQRCAKHGPDHAGSRLGYRSKRKCTVCNVVLCRNKQRNCFERYHTQLQLEYPACIPPDRRRYEKDHE